MKINGYNWIFLAVGGVAHAWQIIALAQYAIEEYRRISEARPEITPLVFISCLKIWAHMDVHFDLSEFDAYMRREIADERRAEIDTHLTSCEGCQEFAAKFGIARKVPRIRFTTHFTSDGVVELWGAQDANRWFGGIEGLSLQSGREASSQSALLGKIRTAFRELFPEHACNSACEIGGDGPNRYVSVPSSSYKQSQTDY